MNIKRRSFLKILFSSFVGFFFKQDIKKLIAAPVILKKKSRVCKAGVSNNDIGKSLSRAVITITGKNDEKLAWRELFSPLDIVGLKLNCLTGYKLSSTQGVVNAIVKGLNEAVGIPLDNIIVWERSERELISSGYKINRLGKGVKIIGTDSNGFGYETKVEMSGSIGSCFSRIVSQHITTLINVPVFKDHNLSGISIGMKNLYGVIHNPNKYHDNNCDPYIPDLASHRFIKDKLRLTVCDAILAQFHGGPSYNPKYCWDFDSILVSRDPVAIDAVGYRIISEKRRTAGLKSLKEEGREPTWLFTAEKKGLGNAMLENIDLIEI